MWTMDVNPRSRYQSPNLVIMPRTKAAIRTRENRQSLPVITLHGQYTARSSVTSTTATANSLDDEANIVQHFVKNKTAATLCVFENKSTEVKTIFDKEKSPIPRSPCPSDRHRKNIFKKIYVCIPEKVNKTKNLQITQLPKPFPTLPPKVTCHLQCQEKQSPEVHISEPRQISYPITMPCHSDPRNKNRSTYESSNCNKNIPIVDLTCDDDAIINKREICYNELCEDTTLNNYKNYICNKSNEREKKAILPQKISKVHLTSESEEYDDENLCTNRTPAKITRFKPVVENERYSNDQPSPDSTTMECINDKKPSANDLRNLIFKMIQSEVAVMFTKINSTSKKDLPNTNRTDMCTKLNATSEKDIPKTNSATTSPNCTVKDPVNKSDFKSRPEVADMLTKINSTSEKDVPITSGTDMCTMLNAMSEKDVPDTNSATTSPSCMVKDYVNLAFKVQSEVADKLNKINSTSEKNVPNTSGTDMCTMVNATSEKDIPNTNSATTSPNCTVKDSVNNSAFNSQPEVSDMLTKINSSLEKDEPIIMGTDMCNMLNATSEKDVPNTNSAPTSPSCTVKYSVNNSALKSQSEVSDMYAKINSTSEKNVPDTSSATTSENCTVNDSINNPAFNTSSVIETEVNFLDDFDIDEIVDALKCPKNTKKPQKKASDTLDIITTNEQIIGSNDNVICTQEKNTKNNQHFENNNVNSRFSSELFNKPQKENNYMETNGTIDSYTYNHSQQPTDRIGNTNSTQLINKTHKKTSERHDKFTTNTHSDYVNCEPTNYGKNNIQQNKKYYSEPISDESQTSNFNTKLQKTTSTNVNNTSKTPQYKSYYHNPNNNISQPQSSITDVNTKLKLMNHTSKVNSKWITEFRKRDYRRKSKIKHNFYNEKIGAIVNAKISLKKFKIPKIKKIVQENEVTKKSSDDLSSTSYDKCINIAESKKIFPQKQICLTKNEVETVLEDSKGKHSNDTNSNILEIENVLSEVINEDVKQKHPNNKNSNSLEICSNLNEVINEDIKQNNSNHANSNRLEIDSVLNELINDPDYCEMTQIQNEMHEFIEGTHAANQIVKSTLIEHSKIHNVIESSADSSVQDIGYNKLIFTHHNSNKCIKHSAKELLNCTKRKMTDVHGIKDTKKLKISTNLKPETNNSDKITDPHATKNEFTIMHSENIFKKRKRNKIIIMEDSFPKQKKYIPMVPEKEKSAVKEKLIAKIHMTSYQNNQDLNKSSYAYPKLFRGLNKISSKDLEGDEISCKANKKYIYKDNQDMTHKASANLINNNTLKVDQIITESNEMYTYKVNNNIYRETKEKFSKVDKFINNTNQNVQIIDQINEANQSYIYKDSKITSQKTNKKASMVYENKINTNKKYLEADQKTHNTNQNEIQKYNQDKIKKQLSKVYQSRNNTNHTNLTVDQITNKASQNDIHKNKQDKTNEKVFKLTNHIDLEANQITNKASQNYIHEDNHDVTNGKVLKVCQSTNITNRKDISLDRITNKANLNYIHKNKHDATNGKVLKECQSTNNTKHNDLTVNQITNESNQDKTIGKSSRVSQSINNNNHKYCAVDRITNLTDRDKSNEKYSNVCKSIITTNHKYLEADQVTNKATQNYIHENNQDATNGEVLKVCQSTNITNRKDISVDRITNRANQNDIRKNKKDKKNGKVLKICQSTNNTNHKYLTVDHITNKDNQDKANEKISHIYQSINNTNHKRVNKTPNKTKHDKSIEKVPKVCQSTNTTNHKNLKADQITNKASQNYIHDDNKDATNGKVINVCQRTSNTHHNELIVDQLKNEANQDKANEKIFKICQNRNNTNHKDFTVNKKTIQSNQDKLNITATNKANQNDIQDKRNEKVPKVYQSKDNTNHKDHTVHQIPTTNNHHGVDHKADTKVDLITNTPNEILMKIYINDDKDTNKPTQTLKNQVSNKIDEKKKVQCKHETNQIAKFNDTKVVPYTSNRKAINNVDQTSGTNKECEASNIRKKENIRQIQTGRKIINTESIQNIMYNRYIIKNVVHNGRYSNVLRAEDMINDNKVVAVKVLRKNIISSPDFTNIIQGIAKADKLNSFHILHQTFVGDSYSCLVMDYYGRNLAEAIECKGGFNISEVQELSRQLMKALMLLRVQEIVHTDIKPTHILINNDNTKIRLGGFDGATRRSNFKHTYCMGTLQYKAPETILCVEGVAGYSADIWSAACTMYEMFKNEKLFQGTTTDMVLEDILKLNGEKKHHSNILFKEQNKLLKLNLNKKLLAGHNSGCQNQLMLFNELLYRMLFLDCQNRISVEFAFLSPFIYK